MGSQSTRHMVNSSQPKIVWRGDRRLKRRVVFQRLKRRANLPNRYSALCWRPVTHAQTLASYSALYRFGRLSKRRAVTAVTSRQHVYKNTALRVLCFAVHFVVRLLSQFLSNGGDRGLRVITGLRVKCGSADMRICGFNNG